jgi:hypothetical protein
MVVIGKEALIGKLLQTAAIVVEEQHVRHSIFIAFSPPQLCKPV